MDRCKPAHRNSIADENLVEPHLVPVSMEGFVDPEYESDFVLPDRLGEFAQIEQAVQQGITRGAKEIINKPLTHASACKAKENLEDDQNNTIIEQLQQSKQTNLKPLEIRLDRL